MTSLHYSRSGSGLPVVLIHAGFLDHRMWSETHAALSANFDVISYDVRGAGKSPRADGDHSPADDLATLLDELGIERAALVGSSMGARIALEFAALRPERARAAVLCSLALPEFVTGDCDGMLPEFIQALTGQHLEVAAQLFTRMWFDGRRDSSSIDTERRAAFAELVDLGFAATFVHQQWRTLAALGPVEAMRTPTLFVTGDDDWPDIHHTVAALDELMPNSATASIAGAAHTVNIDQPLAVHHEINRFLTSQL